MGTRFESVLAGDRESNLRAAAEAAFAEIECLHNRWTFFSSTSLVSRINREAALHPVPLDADTRDLLRLALDTWRDTEGCFDITIAPLMRRWGLRAPPLTERGGVGFGSEEEPLSKRGGTQTWGSRCLRLDDTAMTLAFADPSRGDASPASGIEIDLGAIAKGAALDAAASILRDAGVTCGLLHGGTSSVTAIGAPPDSPRGWPIRLGPDADAPVVHLRDAALGVSAHYGRTARAGDDTVGHIIDPRTGVPGLVESRYVVAPSRPAGQRPVPPKATLAACIHPSAALADAWSTALLVRGYAQGLRLPPNLHFALRAQDTWTYSDTFHRVATLGAPP